LRYRFQGRARKYTLGSYPALGLKDARSAALPAGKMLDSFSYAKSRLDAAIAAENGGPIPSWTIHDIRRSVTTGLAGLSVNLPVIEKILNHTSGSFAGVVGIYQRHSFADEMRAAMDLWSRRIEALVSGETGKVVEFSSARA
jgi:integrase